MVMLPLTLDLLILCILFTNYALGLPCNLAVTDSSFVGQPDQSPDQSCKAMEGRKAQPHHEASSKKIKAAVPVAFLEADNLLSTI